MNKREIVTRAYWRINVAPFGDPEDAPQTKVGLECYEQVIADMNGPRGGCLLPFTVDDEVPPAYRQPLIDLLSVRLAPYFERTPPVAEITAMMRIRAVNKPYVRDACTPFPIVLDDAEDWFDPGDPVEDETAECEPDNGPNDEYF